MSQFGDNQRTTLVVTYAGVTHELDGDRALLFQAKLNAGKPFTFTFPGDLEPTEVDFVGLSTYTKTTVAE